MTTHITRRGFLLASGGLTLAGIAGLAVATDDARGRQMDGSPMAGGSPMAMGGGAGAAFMTIANSGSEDDTLTGGSTDVAEIVEVHEMKLEGDVMMMSPLADGLVIPAGESMVLKPGGYHIMLINLLQDLKPNSTYKLTLTFAKAGEVELEVPIYATEGMAEEALTESAPDPVVAGDLQITGVWSRMAPMLSGSPEAMPEGTPDATPGM